MKEKEYVELASAYKADPLQFTEQTPERARWLIDELLERIERLGGWCTCGFCGEHGDYYFASGCCHDCEVKRVGHSVRAPY